jgi:hypothetical protein
VFLPLQPAAPALEALTAQAPRGPQWPMRPAATAHRPRARTFAARRAGAALGRPGAERRLLGTLEAAAAVRSHDARLRAARMAHVYRGARGCEQDERRPDLANTSHGRGGDIPATAVGSNAPAAKRGADGRTPERQRSPLTSPQQTQLDKAHAIFCSTPERMIACRVLRSTGSPHADCPLSPVQKLGPCKTPTCHCRLDHSQLSYQIPLHSPSQSSHRLYDEGPKRKVTTLLRKEAASAIGVAAAANVLAGLLPTSPRRSLSYSNAYTRVLVVDW